MKKLQNKTKQNVLQTRLGAADAGTREHTHTFQFEEEVEDIKLLSRSLKKYNRHRRKK